MTMPEDIKCGVCGKIVKGRVPKGGDGSVLVPYRHIYGYGVFTQPGRACPGHLQEGKPV